MFDGTRRKRGSAVINTKEELFKRIKQKYEELHLD